MFFRELFKMNLDVVDWVNLFSRVGLLLFFSVFVCVAVYAFTRRRKDVSRWSELALTDSAPPSATRPETLP
jgi:cbb3-type cytochrome oxidase subunit 3